MVTKPCNLTSSHHITEQIWYKLYYYFKNMNQQILKIFSLQIVVDKAYSNNHVYVVILDDYHAL